MAAPHFTAVMSPGVCAVAAVKPSSCPPTQTEAEPRCVSCWLAFVNYFFKLVLSYIHALMRPSVSFHLVRVPFTGLAAALTFACDTGFPHEQVSDQRDLIEDTCVIHYAKPGLSKALA